MDKAIPLARSSRPKRPTLGGNPLENRENLRKLSGKSKNLEKTIVSTAKIGLDKVIPGIQRPKTGTAYAIASRDLDRAKEAAKGLGIEKAYGSYEELLADPEIDAIYNPLPNHMHVPVTIQAVNAGKHVLCEKPVAGWAP